MCVEKLEDSLERIPDCSGHSAHCGSLLVFTVPKPGCMWANHHEPSTWPGSPESDLGHLLCQLSREPKNDAPAWLQPLWFLPCALDSPWRLHEAGSLDFNATKSRAALFPQQHKLRSGRNWKVLFWGHSQQATSAHQIWLPASSLDQGRRTSHRDCEQGKTEAIHVHSDSAMFHFLSIKGRNINKKWVVLIYPIVIIALFVHNRRWVCISSVHWTSLEKQDLMFRVGNVLVKSTCSSCSSHLVAHNHH